MSRPANEATRFLRSVGCSELLIEPASIAGFIRGLSNDDLRVIRTGHELATWRAAARKEQRRRRSR